MTRPTGSSPTGSDPADSQPRTSAAPGLAIKAEDLGVSSGGFTLLSPTDITLAAGRNLVIGGDNGSGKTTLLSVLTGLLPATTGKVSVCGLSAGCPPTTGERISAQPSPG